jgi:glycerophosphoryl diester phosphodiesterase
MWFKIGHRGAAGYEPENTLRSINRALAIGVDMVEIDVQQSADGQLVVIHDKRVDRTTNGSGYVAEMDVADLRCLDAGLGEKVPLLEEVLELLSGRVGLMIEIISPGIADKLVDLIKRKPFDRPLIAASFHHDELLRVRKAWPDAKTLALLEGVPVDKISFAREARVTHVGLAMESITASFIRQIKEANLSIFVYTANDARDIAELHRLNVDGVISDFPDRLGL